jgi:hypothetical protein
MSQKIATLTIREEDNDIRVSCDFHQSISVDAMFPIIGHAIAGMFAVASKVGKAKGMSDEEIERRVKGEAANTAMTRLEVEGE